MRAFQAKANKKVFSKRCKKQLVGCSSELALLTRSFSYFTQQISAVFEWYIFLVDQNFIDILSGYIYFFWSSIIHAAIMHTHFVYFWAFMSEGVGRRDLRSQQANFYSCFCNVVSFTSFLYLFSLPKT